MSPEQMSQMQQFNMERPPAGVAIPNPIEGMPNIGLSTDDLLELQDQMEKGKKRSGYILLFFLTILEIGILLANAYYFRSANLALWSILVYIFFVVIILSTKFDMLSKAIDRFMPYLKEPKDFLKVIKENKKASY